MMNAPRILAALALLLQAGIAAADSPSAWLDTALPELLKEYRHFHQNPELSFHEEKSAALLAADWKALGAEVHTGIGGYGVVGLLRNGDGPTVMVRGDMDALPVKETTGLDYASRVTALNPDGTSVPVTHACGHDIHMTNLLGVARYLAARKDQWRGTLMLVAQPAEERGAGARAMLDDGLFTRFPKPDFALGLHVNAGLETGKLRIGPGYLFANVDSVDIRVRGKGGHGAWPHVTIDPVVQASRLVMDLQTIISREIEPTAPAVITVGSMHCGTKHNIISDECRLQLTVRSYSDEVRAHLLAAIERKAKASAASARAPEPEVTVSESTPAVYNDPALAERLAVVLKKELGADNVLKADPVMGGEDFSHFGRDGVPAFYFWLGAVDAERLARYTRDGGKPPSLHSAGFYPEPEQTLRTGVRAMSQAVLELLGKP